MTFPVQCKRVPAPTPFAAFGASPHDGQTGIAALGTGIQLYQLNLGILAVGTSHTHQAFFFCLGHGFEALSAFGSQGVIAVQENMLRIGAVQNGEDYRRNLRVKF